MTKGRTALSLNLVVPPTIPMDVVHFSLYLPQASRGARDDKGEGSAPIGCDGGNDNLTDVVHFSLYLPQASQIAPSDTGGGRSCCRANGARILQIDFPALPGWADVWQSALRALQGWVRNNPTQAKRRLEWATHLLLVQRVPVSFLSQLAAGGASIGRVGGNDNSRTLFIPDETCRQV